MVTEGSESLIKTVDLGAIAALGSGERLIQRLVDRDSGRHCMISIIRTPAQGGSPEGLHTHEVDQFFFILSGSMQVEINSAVHTASAGALVTFPAGVPHQNWNRSGEPSVHLSIMAPIPPEGRPFASPAQVESAGP